MQTQDHPLRYDIVNELHARPFPVAGCAVVGRVSSPSRTRRMHANRDRESERAHLLDILDRHATAHPQPGATHFSGPIGRAELKWESHTEFVTYSAFTPGVSARPFDPFDAEVFPDDWLQTPPANGWLRCWCGLRTCRQTKARCCQAGRVVCPRKSGGGAGGRGAAVVAGGFPHRSGGAYALCRLCPAGDRPRRVGRIVQRLCEIETYRAMSMLGLIRARELDGG